MTPALFDGIGVLASVVPDRRLIELFEAMLERLPLVQTRYGAAARFRQSLCQPPVGGQRLMPISFPAAAMEAVGPATRVLGDAISGRDLAVVPVPTSPKPTSGHRRLPTGDRYVWKKHRSV